jgi:hypothetical protein
MERTHDQMFGIGLTLSVVAIAAVALRRWLLVKERPHIDGGAVSRSWLAEYKLAKRDSGYRD